MCAAAEFICGRAPAKVGLLQGFTAQAGGETTGLLSGDKGGVELIFALRSIFINRSFREEMVNRLLCSDYRGENR